MTDDEIVFKKSYCDTQDVHMSKNPTSSSSSDTINAQPSSYQTASETDVWSACNMYRQRVIEAKPTLLSPKSVSKLYGNSKQKSSEKSSTCSQLVSPEKPHPVRLATAVEKSVETPGIGISDSASSGKTSIERLSDVSDNNLLKKANSRSEIHNTSSLPPLHIRQLHNQQSWEDNKPDTIQISPTIQFPVSRIKSDEFFQTDHLQSPALSLRASVSSLNDDLESLDQSSEISTYSYSSSMSFNQELAMHPDLFSLQKTGAKTVEGYQYQHEDYEKEAKELRSALKLAEADTAILVSSKQQLQLDNHDLNETVKMLNYEISKLKQDITEKDVNIAVLKRNNSTSETKSAELLQLAEDNLQTMQTRFEETNNKLDSVTLENNQLKNKRDEISRNLDTTQATNKSLEAEVNQLMTKCAHLDSRLNETVDDNSDTSAYITSLREERDNYAVKVHSQEQELIRKQRAISQLEERHNAVSEQHNALSVSYQTLLQVSKTKESAIASLQSRLAAKEKEKQALDGAISRLHENLFRVEASFTKIKNEMIQKTKASNQEITIKEHFEKQIVSLKDDLKRVQNDCRTFTQKISDKNNQISQLSEQLKRTLLSKRRCDSEIKTLKAEVVDKQKSWKEVVEKEKKLLNVIEQKSLELSRKEEMLSSSTAAVEEFNFKLKKLQGMLDDSETQLNTKDKELGMLKYNLETLQKISIESANDLESKNNLINELETEVHRCTRTNSTLSQQLEDMKIAHEKTELAASPADEHLAAVVSQLQASRREISEQNSKLEREKKNLVENFERLRSENGNLEARLSVMMTEKQNMQKHTDFLQEGLVKAAGQLEESKKNEQNSSRKLSQLNEEFSLLKDRLAATKYSLTQSKIDLKSKIKELSALSLTNATLNEELETAKKEMNSASLKVVELINSKQENNDDQEKIDLFGRLQTSEAERTKLNEAVLQQQRYISSLQTHYQKWANDAAVKFEELQAKLLQQNSKPVRDVGSQTSHEEKPLPSSPLSALATPSFTSTCDSSTQTCHDEKPISPSPVKNAAKTRNICSSCGKLIFNRSQGDTLLNEAPVGSIDEVSVLKTTANTQTDTVIKSMSKYVQTSEISIEASKISSASVSCQTPAKPQSQTKSISTQTAESTFAKNIIFNSSVNVASQTNKSFDSTTKGTNYTPSVHCDVATMTAVNVTNSSCQSERFQNLSMCDSATQTTVPENVLLTHAAHGATQTEFSTSEKSSQKSTSLQSSFTQTEFICPTLAHSYTKAIENFGDPVQNSPEKALVKKSVCTNEKFVQTDSEILATDSMLKSANALTHSPSQTDVLECLIAHASTQTATADTLPDIVLPSNIPAFQCVDIASQTVLKGDVAEVNLSQKLSCSAPKLVAISPVQTSNVLSQTECGVKNTASQIDFQEVFADSTFIPSRNASLSFSVQEGVNILPVQRKNAFSQIEIGYCNAFCQTEDIDLTKTTSKSSRTTTCLSISSPNVINIAPILSENALFQQNLECNSVTCQTELEKDLLEAAACPSQQARNLSFSVPRIIDISPVSTKNELSQTEIALANVVVQTNEISFNETKNNEMQTEVSGPSGLNPGLSQVQAKQVSEPNQIDENRCRKPNPQICSDISTQTSKIALESVSCNTDAEFRQDFIHKGGAFKNCATQTIEKEEKIHFNALQGQTVPDENICSHCGQNVLFSKRNIETTIESFTQTESNSISLPQFPDTNDFLNHINNEDRAKLKAYKQTVKVLRGKLKRAEKQLATSQDACNSLQLELEELKYASIAERVVLDQAISDKHASNNLEKELNQWKESAQERDALIESLQNEIVQVKKRHGVEKDKMRRKSKADKMIKEKKMKDVNERLKMLVDANERLRKNVDKLQIKLTASNKQLDACQREKLRYQQRARKLQADLRSLSWIASSTPEPVVDENAACKEQFLAIELPEAVREIDCMLKDLKSEIGVLEEQLHQHSSALHNSTISFKELRVRGKTTLDSGDAPVVENSEVDSTVLNT